MYHGHSKGREDGRSRGHIGRSPPRRRRSPEGGNKFCMYCKVQISSQRAYDEHCNSAVHKQKEIIIAKAISDGLQYCYTCEKIFPSKLALDAHCLMTRHKPLYRVDELQPSANQSVNMSNLIQVVTPPLNDTDSRRAREDKEREDIVMKLKEVRGTEETDNVQGKKDISVNSDRRVEVKEHFCELCNVDCMSSANYKIHIESWRHRSEMDKKDEKRKKIEARKKFEEEAEKTFDAAEEAERKKVPDDITGKAGYFCEVCSIALADESHYLEHLLTRKHFRSMRKPYKCYFCKINFNLANDFNYHLESKSHMDKAFNRVKDGDKSKKPDKDDEWVEKKTDRQESRSKDDNRDTRKDDHSSRKDDHSRRHGDRKVHTESRSKDGKKDIRKAEIKEKSPKNADFRKVEIIDSPAPDSSGIKDLREKLKAQKIIITKENSPEKPPVKKPAIEEPPTFADNQGGEEEKLELIEREFESKFKELIKECDNDHAALQERLAKEREEDISTYQKYEDDFKELQEVEDFNRSNIEKLEDGDPCKEDFIIDIIRVQRKMEDLRQQMEVKEMMIIKREILYRKHFPEKNDEKPPAQAEVNVDVKNNSVGYDYSHSSGNANEEVKEKASTVEADKGNNVPEAGTTDLRVKLERERLLKRLGPELEAVDPTLREKLISVIMEKDQVTENGAKLSKSAGSSKSSKDPKTGDTRQVLKDSHSRQTQMDILTKREKQLEIELAKLKENAMATVNKKKADKPEKLDKPATKSLVPQYDDVDDKKKKDVKKRPRKRSLSMSSVSSSSTSSSDISRAEKKIKKKRKKSPGKPRVKSRTGSTSGDKTKRKRRSSSRDREKKKKIISKKVKDDDKKKKPEKLKTEKKKAGKPTSKAQVKGDKVAKDSNAVVEDNDSDVQIITKPISVIGSTSVTSSSISTQVTTTTIATPSTVPPKPKEQFSCWKSSSQARMSPKEDIWDSAFSGGQEEDTAVSSTMNLFDPSSGTPQLPEDILNILKSVAPIIQQTKQQSSPPKDPPKEPPPDKSPETNAQEDEYTEEDETFNNKEEVLNKEPVSHVEETTTRIRSILKKVSNQAPALQNINSSMGPQSSSGISELVPSVASSTSMPAIGYSSSAVSSRGPEDRPSPVLPRRPDNVGRSILKQRSSYADSTFTDSGNLYEKPYTSADRIPPRHVDQKEGPIPNKYGRIDTREYEASDGKPYGNAAESMQNSGPDTRMRNNEWQDTNMTRKDAPLGNSRPYNESQIPDNIPQRPMYRETSMDYKQNESLCQDIYDNAVRQASIPSLERDRADRILPSRLKSTATSRGIQPSGPLSSESPGAYYNLERNPRPREPLREQPFVRAEVTHRVIDYSYVRDTRILPEQKSASPPRYSSDDTPKQPVRYPGETDDEYYARFERFYEMTRRKEGDRTQQYPLKKFDDSRVNPDTRQRPPPREDLYRPSDRKLERFDELLPSRLPPVDNYLPQRSLTSYDRNPPPMGRRDDIVPLQGERDRYVPYRREEIVESRYTTERNIDSDYVQDYRARQPIQDPLKPLPPQHRLPPSPHRMRTSPPRQPQQPQATKILEAFQDY